MELRRTSNMKNITAQSTSPWNFRLRRQRMITQKNKNIKLRSLQKIRTFHAVHTVIERLQCHRPCPGVQGTQVACHSVGGRQALLRESLSVQVSGSTPNRMSDRPESSSEHAVFFPPPLQCTVPHPPGPGSRLLLPTVDKKPRSRLASPNIPSGRPGTTASLVRAGEAENRSLFDFSGQVTHVYRSQSVSDGSRTDDLEEFSLTSPTSQATSTMEDQF